MNKLDLATWLSTVSFRNGANTFKGRTTLAKWVTFYMSMSKAQLQDEYKSYGC